MLNGKSASDGHAVGKIVLYEKPDIEVKKGSCDNPEDCLKTLNEALDQAYQDLDHVREKALESMGQEHAEIFEAHQQMVNDPEIKSQVKAMIENDKVDPAYAYKEVTDQFITIFEGMDDEYFRGRAADIKDIQYRVLALLKGLEYKDLSALSEDSIVVANDLAPSDTAGLNLDYVKGFITEVGGMTSHTAIMARALSLPAMVGVKDALKTLKDGETVYLNATDGDIVRNPDEKTLEKAKARVQEQEKVKARLRAFKDKATKTKDGSALPLFANVGSDQDVPIAREGGAEGVGLFRTEFLFMNSDTMPDEETQRKAYLAVFEAFHPVIVRTLDIGGDKSLPYLEQEQEMNPFLGKRAIRLTLQEKDLFKTQIRALLTAAKDQKDVRIMFPMIARKDELLRAKEVVHDVIADLDNEGKSYQSNIQYGIMIEIPAAALNARSLAKEVDFFSIGTNDLIQYTYAADRMNENVSYLYEPFDPTLLRLMKRTLDDAHEEGTEIGVCGEMAGDLDAGLILSGMGMDELSMSPGSILPLREALSKVTKDDLKALSDEVLALDDAETVKAKVDTFKKTHGIE
ncbi:MAG: phosphoenolpyruvate--protein phosphotransferase [Bacillota bacterium]